jgi:hypothetical protein
MAQLLLFVFTSFLITPTIVSVFEKNSDVSEFYSYSDQEKVNKEIEAVFSFDIEYVPNDFSFLNSSLIHFEYLSKHDKIFSKIFIPPPERA